MAESFVLRYPPPDSAADDCEWVVVDGYGARVGEVGRGPRAKARSAQNRGRSPR